MYDIIIIGGGAGGMTVASGAASLGAKTALIEKRGSLGGDCLHYGCVPSKALIEAANEIYAARNNSYAGVEASGEVDLGKIMERVNQAVDTIQESDSKERFEAMGVDVYEGSPQFLGDRKLEVEGTVLQAKKIVIATGSSVNIPPIKGLKNADYWTNESVFSQTELPRSLTFIGAGPVGLEIAQAFARLGCEVTVLEGGGTILKKEDPSIRDRAMEILSREITFITEARVEKVSEGGKKVHYRKNGKEHSLTTDKLFLAAGRKPNTEGMDLEETGVTLDDKGFVHVDDTMRTSNPHIFAIGDVTGHMLFTHVAGEHGKLVVQNALYSLKRKMSYETMPWNTYTNPEIFHIGKTREEVEEAYVYETPLSEVDRFVAERATEGFVKIITDRKGRMIGAHAIGKGAGDWMQPVVSVMNRGGHIKELSGMVYPYPNHTAALEDVSGQYWRLKLFSGLAPVLSRRFLKWFL